MAIYGGVRVLAILLLACYQARGLEESQIAFPPASAAGDAPAFSPVGADGKYALSPGGPGDAPAFSPSDADDAYAIPPGGRGNAPALSPGGMGAALIAVPPVGWPGDDFALPPGSAPGAPALSPGDAAYNELADDELFNTDQDVSDTFSNSLTVAKPRRGRNFDIPDPSEKIFNVLQFGAKSDGKKDCTQVIIIHLLAFIYCMPLA